MKYQLYKYEIISALSNIEELTTNISWEQSKYIETPAGGKATVRLRSAIARVGSPAARGKRRCINYGSDGYKLVVDRLSEKDK